MGQRATELALGLILLLLESWLDLTQNSWSLLESSHRTFALKETFGYTEAHTSRPLWPLIFTFWAVITQSFRIEVFRHGKPFRELKIRFTEGLQLPVTWWHFLFVMLWVLVDRDRKRVITTSCNQDWVFLPQRHLCTISPP